MELLKRRGWINKVILISFDWAFIAAANALLPELVIGLNGPRKARSAKRLFLRERRLSKATVDAAIAIGARLLVWNHLLDPEGIAYAHAHGLKVLVYTINRPADAKQLIAAGVDGIITNETAAIRRLFE